MINLKYFNQDNDFKCSEKEKFFIENYITKYDNNSYLVNCNDEEYDFHTLFHLSSISQNIINWYEFEPKSKVLQIELNLGNITEALAINNVDLTVVTNSKEKAEVIEKRCSNIKDFEIICGQLKNIEFNTKYDYIVLIGGLALRHEIYGQEINIKNFLTYLDGLLNKKGKLLIALDNKFAIRNFSGGNDHYTNKKFDSLTGYMHSKDRHYSISKSKIDSILKDIGMKTINHYYPLPDFRIPNVIFSDEWLPNYTNFSKYEPYTVDDEQFFISEIQMFRELLKENKELFKTFTNSFFIEAGKTKFDIKYKFVSYNNMRKAKYRLITKIGSEYVEKDITNVYSKEHYNNIRENIKLLNEENYDILDTVENDAIKSKYVNTEYMVSNILANILENEESEKKDEFFRFVDKFFELFYKKSKKISANEETIFDKYGIQISNKEELNYLENGFWDATFNNCFYIEDKFYFFDQEWRERNVPVEYLIYKSFFYDNFISKHVKLEQIAQKYNFSQCIEAFKELDLMLQQEIRDEKIWKFYAGTKVLNWEIHTSAINEIKNESIRLKSENEYLKNKLKDVEEIIQRSTIFKITNKVRKFFRRKK